MSGRQLHSSRVPPQYQSSTAPGFHSAQLHIEASFTVPQLQSGRQTVKTFSMEEARLARKDRIRRTFHFSLFKNTNTNVQLACLARKTGSDQAFPTIAHQQPISIASFAPIFAHFCSHPWGKTALTSSFNPALPEQLCSRKHTGDKILLAGGSDRFALISGTFCF